MKAASLAARRSLLLTILGWIAICILFAMGPLRASDGPYPPVLSALFPWGVTCLALFLWGFGIISSLGDLIRLKPRGSTGWWLALFCLLLCIVPFAVFAFVYVFFITWPAS